MTPRKHQSLMWGAALLGAVCLLGAFILRLDDMAGTLHAILVTVGAAVFLVIPIEWLTNQLRREVKTSAEDQDAKVEDLREENREQWGAVRDRLTELEQRDAEVVKAQQSEREQDHQLFDAVKKSGASGETVWRALNKAERLSLISKKGVHVPYGETSDLTVVFKASPQNPTGNNRVIVTLLDADMRRVDSSPRYLDSRESLTDFLRKLHVAARKHGDNSEALISTIFGRFAETLNLNPPKCCRGVMVK